MAYNYPNFLNSPQFPQNYPAMQQLQSGFVSVRSEAEARNYPVGYGNSVTFKDETSPYVYTKTMGFSQLDRPVFEKYKLVKEDIEEEREVSVDSLRPQVAELQAQIESIWKEINFLKDRRKRRDDNESNGNGKPIQAKPNGFNSTEV